MMIRCMLLFVLYVYYDLIKCFGGGSVVQVVVYVGMVEYGGDLLEQFEMFFGCGFWYQQDEEQVDWCVVQCVEVYGSIQVQYGVDGVLVVRQVVVWNGDVIVEVGGIEFFLGYQVFEDGLGVEFWQFFGYQVGDLFEYVFFVVVWYVYEGMVGGQDLFKLDYRGGEISGCLCFVVV